MNTKAVVTNQYGAYTLELHQDGTVTILQFDAAPPGKKFRGLGDVIAAGTNAVGIPSCKGCRRRQEALNRLVPFANENPPPAGQLPAAASGGEKND